MDQLRKMVIGLYEPCNGQEMVNVFKARRLGRGGGWDTSVECRDKTLAGRQTRTQACHQATEFSESRYEDNAL
jgi:hypothetical protein